MHRAGRRQRAYALVYYISTMPALWAHGSVLETRQAQATSVSSGSLVAGRCSQTWLRKQNCRVQQPWLAVHRRRFVTNILNNFLYFLVKYKYKYSHKSENVLNIFSYLFFFFTFLLMKLIVNNIKKSISRTKILQKSETTRRSPRRASAAFRLAPVRSFVLCV